MSKTLYVGNLDPSVTEAELREFFDQCGTSRDAKISVDYKGRSKGFAFVEMDSDAEGEGAIAKFNGAELKGQALTVNAAKPPASRDLRKVLAGRRNRGRS